MARRTRVTTEDLARGLALKLQISADEAQTLLEGMCSTLREHLQAGQSVEVGDLFTLSVSGGAELREDDSGGFSAYAPTSKGLKVAPLGTLKDDLERACNAAIYYVSLSKGRFIDLLTDHFGRRGWSLVQTKNAMEVHTRMERQPCVALIYESHTEGWRELVRELKCNPRTNWVPVVGIFPKDQEEEPISQLTVLPDEIIHEPFDFSEFIQTAGSELAARVTTPQHDITELTLQLPGNERVRREAREMVEEILFRSTLPESFNSAAASALSEALDNAVRHGHQMVECCTITVRMLLDPKRLVLVVRDTGEGFDHAAALTAARGRRGRDSALAKAADALRTRRGDARQGGIARMLKLVDRVEFNRTGTEIVLTKSLPSDDE
jgi:anti-sigma regulatory factor (Ser/Thr protein kinase)